MSTPERWSGPQERTAAFVRFLMDSDVVRFGDFVGKSGRSMPYFIDLGRFRTGRQLATLGRFYAAMIEETFGDEVDVLFGPAYKGIALAVATSIALADHHGRDVGVCFDRKEAKDHGEGGALIGHHPSDGDRVVIIEDVTTAGTSIRTSVPMLRGLGDVEVIGLAVGVDRRERGEDDRAALDEVADTYGLRTAALADVDDLVLHLSDVEVDGVPVLDGELRRRIAAYRAAYGPR